ncbi:hypothetical protein HPB51_011210 [Rhipicephalus microplus]|uniref:Uncharacterized protein n=1 Tax=Rhipicephalus microplus TaxID=6941 RepID=A0A9J6F1B8_RHIMP|nr:hypothetical protein HPB51_011210 [Rhipicephalus microplus]
MYVKLEGSTVLQDSISALLFASFVAEARTLPRASADRAVAFSLTVQCFRRYQTAQILLHSLAQQVENDDDRALLNRYKDAVEKRLYVLQSEGLVCAYDSSC